MCNFISWVEYEGAVYFLTSKDLNTKKGKNLRKLFGLSYYDNIAEHIAIRRYWGIPDTQGINKRCDDFSTPNNFPKEIVEAIKKGLLNGIGIYPKILTASALAKYNKFRSAQNKYEKPLKSAQARYKKIQQLAWKKYLKTQQPAWDKYRETEQSAWEKYEETEQAAYSQYEKIKQSIQKNIKTLRPAWRKYMKIEQSALDRYEEIKEAAWNEYKKFEQPARNKYEKFMWKKYREILQPIQDEYMKKQHSVFWKLAINPKNRIETWRN